MITKVLYMGYTRDKQDFDFRRAVTLSLIHI